jgi:magnesium transporter
MFEATIEEIVAVAILMPIVASMAGNAGTQSLTVAVRALATHDLTAANATRIVFKELLVGFANGLLFAVMVTVVGGVWFAMPELGLVVGIATLFTMTVGTVAGILVPLGLKKFGIDPAIASSVFVTMVTDVVGFFSFLGLVALLLL